MFSLDQALKNNWKLNNNNNNKRLSPKLKIKYKNYMCVCVCVCVFKRKLLFKYCHSLTLHIFSVDFFSFDAL